MSLINAISNNNYLPSIFSSAIQNAGSNNNQNNLFGVNSSSFSPTDSQQLSPFAQIASSLQQLQQNNPAQYQQVTAQIATNLQSAAQTAQANGNTTAATQLNQLASDFSTASSSGQLPSLQDLAQATGSHHHHHHHSHSQPGSNSSTDPNQTLSQLFSSSQTGGAQNDPLNPATIILNTLNGAGITGSSANATASS